MEVRVLVGHALSLDLGPDHEGVHGPADASVLPLPFDVVDVARRQMLRMLYHVMLMLGM